MKPLLIIKLGGSVITDKLSKAPKANLKVIKSLARQVKTISKDYQIILVHGAGSFGHPLAKKYQLNLGFKSEEQKLGFALTSNQMINLNQILISELLKNNLLAVSLPPHSFLVQEKGKLVNFDTKLIKDYLKNNFLPVLFGDGVLDNFQGCSIVSGDTLVPFLAKKLNPEKVIFVSDVDGIFNKDPKKYKDAEIIKEVNNQNLEEVLQGLTLNNPDDVTGEMQGKILKIKDNLKNIPVFIINGLAPKTLLEVDKKGQVGTKLLLH